WMGVVRHNMARMARVTLAELLVHPVLPVGVAEPLARRGHQELPRDEEVVRDRVGGQMGEVAEPDRLQPIGVRGLVDLLPDVPVVAVPPFGYVLDRKSTRLNSSHVKISYAVFCLK